MADELFLQAFSHAKTRRFERRLGLSTNDASKSCGARFLSKLESAIFSRVGAQPETEREARLAAVSFPRGDVLRG